jgi:glucoamylase
MASLDLSQKPAGRHVMKLEGAPRLFVLDAGAVAEGEQPDMAVLRKLALLAESEQAQVVIRGVSERLRQRLEDLTRAGRFHPQLAPDRQQDSLNTLLARAGVPAKEALLLLAEGKEPAPAGSHAFYLGSGEPPAGTVAVRLPGPRGADALLALYGTALVQEKAGQAFRATSVGQLPPASVPFDEEIFEGFIKSLGRPAAQEVQTVAPAPDLDGPSLRALAGQCWAKVQSHILPNGAIVASPAKGEQPGQPNYWFVWQRDAGHTLLNMIDWARSSPFGLPKEPIEAGIKSYLGFLTSTQASGNLGVSRYTVAGQPVTGYGNPQLDGPPIGVLAMTRLPDPRPYYPQIRTYLNYLLTPEGQGPCYDAWEFVYGRILNVLLLKRKAFRAGARLASLLAEDADMRRYQDETARLEGEIEPFIDPQRGYLVSSRDPADPWLAEISGLDAATLAALLTAWDANDDFFSLTHPAVVGTLLALEDAFASLYAVNRAWRAAGHAGIGWGRFPEDANDGVGSTGGNPWPLATLWAAQYCYMLAEQIATTGPFVVTDDRQVRYFNRVAGAEIARVGELIAKETVLDNVLAALRRRGDTYLQFVLAHKPPDGSLTEQINRDTGQPQGARDLTWALSELLNTLMMRG